MTEMYNFILSDAIALARAVARAHNGGDVAFSVDCQQQVPLRLLGVNGAGAIYKEHQERLHAGVQILQVAHQRVHS